MEHLPHWFKIKIRMTPGENLSAVRRLVKDLNLHTVCEGAGCPNIWECWNQGTATFMILGEVCTRDCGFCGVHKGRPLSVDEGEPLRVAMAVKALGLRHAVVTSVTRDDIEDGGASIFANIVREIRRLNPETSVELLIPDFRGCDVALSTVLDTRPDILNHNMETVKRLYPEVRSQADYYQSLRLLEKAKVSGIVTKSGLILGMGETIDEIREVMVNLRAVGCEILTLGQYLRPSKNHRPVTRFYHPEEFDMLKMEGMEMGFRYIEAGPLVRSSYHAERQRLEARKTSP
ncbi:MAG: lipoyl synthase [Deltaproteobacteria bacterium]|nr:lipoyl synthase [Deltaproteobacteria bacterium]